MASEADILNFEDTYAPLASEAGTQLGVAPANILSQWAYETGYGTSLAGSNNLAGLTSGGSFANYDSPQDFEQAYVNDIQNDFPSAQDSGTNIQGFVSGLENGVLGSYFGNQSPVSYGAGISSTGGALASSNPTLFQKLETYNPFASGNQSEQVLAGSGGGFGTSLPSGLSATFGQSQQSGWGPFLSEIATRAALTVLGLFLILGGFYILGQQSGVRLPAVVPV